MLTPSIGDIVWCNEGHKLHRGVPTCRGQIVDHGKSRTRIYCRWLADHSGAADAGVHRQRFDVFRRRQGDRFEAEFFKDVF